VEEDILQEPWWCQETEGSYISYGIKKQTLGLDSLRVVTEWPSTYVTDGGPVFDDRKVKKSVHSIVIKASKQLHLTSFWSHVKTITDEEYLRVSDYTAIWVSLCVNFTRSVL